MDPAQPSAPDYVERRALLLLLLAVTLALGWILTPFYEAILWGAILALLSAPVYRWLLPRLRGKPNAAALATLLLVLVIVILPVTLVAVALAGEAAMLYQRLQSGELNPALYFHGVFDALPHWIKGLLDRFGMADFAALQRRTTALLTQGTQFIATQAVTVGQNTFSFAVSLFIALYLAFFLIRDGRQVVRTLHRAIPLAPAHKAELLDKFSTVVRATIKGNLLVALVQGTLGGLAFWFLDVSGALLWAVLMAFLSLLPAIGAALVWFPVALYFLATGSLWQGIALMLYGLLVIGLIDNLLRPILVGKDTGMPDYMVMIATVGGMAVFGINGFVLGPVIAAMFISVWHIHVSTKGASARVKA